MLDHVKVCGQDTPSKADTSAETGGDGERTGGDMASALRQQLLVCPVGDLRVLGEDGKREEMLTKVQKDLVRSFRVSGQKTEEHRKQALHLYWTKDHRLFFKNP